MSHSASQSPSILNVDSLLGDGGKDDSGAIGLEAGESRSRKVGRSVLGRSLSRESKPSKEQATVTQRISPNKKTEALQSTPVMRLARRGRREHGGTEEVERITESGEVTME